MAEFQLAKERFRLLVENVKDYAIFMLDAEGHVISWNAGAERIKGYRAKEIIGRHFSCFYPAEESARGRPQLALLRAVTDGHCEEEGWRLRKDGSRFWANVILTAVYDDSGQLRGFAKVTRDISQRKETEGKLRQAERLAAIGEMMTALAHESRNALQQSQACLDLLLLKASAQPELCAIVADIQKAQERLHHLYEEVRGYAAPLVLNQESCDLGEVLCETWRQLAVLRNGRTVRLEQRNQGLDLSCWVDRLAVGQVFRNILENSLSACADPVEICATWTPAGDNGQAGLRISLKDNGPGLTPEARRKLFEPFFTTKPQGTGLGLAISRRIVEAHHGEIAAGAEGGGNPPFGAEIVITLPRQTS